MTFADKHRVENRLEVEERGSRLLAGPMKGSRGMLLGVTSWMIFICCIGITLMSWLNPEGFDRKMVAAICAVSPLPIASVVAILYAFLKADQAKGTVIEVDRLSRLLFLSRDKLEIGFDAIEGVSLLIGYYEWSEDLDRVAELRLLVVGTSQPVPVVMTRDVVGAGKLAERVAAMLDLPLECDRLTRPEWQRSVTREK